MNQSNPLAELRSVAQQMSSNPADAMAMASQLQRLARELPPDRGEVISRVDFSRASLWTYAAIFESVVSAEENEIGPQIIRMQEDIWVRGIQAQALISYFTQSLPDDYDAGGIPRAYNTRWAFDLNFRIAGRRGFVSSGNDEILAPALTIAGDGARSAPLDWKLQRNQTIEVRVRPKLQQVFGADAVDPTSEGYFVNSSRLLVVTFWGEAI